MCLWSAKHSVELEHLISRIPFSKCKWTNRSQERFCHKSCSRVQLFRRSDHCFQFEGRHLVCRGLICERWGRRTKSFISDISLSTSSMNCIMKSTSLCFSISSVWKFVIKNEISYPWEIMSAAASLPKDALTDLYRLSSQYKESLCSLR